MTVNTHPPTEVLADYISGALPMAPGLVVSAHAEHCPECRRKLRLLEDVAGALLDQTEGAPMAPGAVEAALARLETAAQVSAPPAPERSRLPDLPAAVAAAGVGFRRWFGPGRWIAPVKATRTEGWRVFLIHGPAGARMPFHGHSGSEFTCVLTGAFQDGPNIFRRGDFVETDPRREHRLEVTNEGPCLSLIACHGPMRGGLITYVVTRLFGV